MWGGGEQYNRDELWPCKICGHPEREHRWGENIVGRVTSVGCSHQDCICDGYEDAE